MLQRPIRSLKHLGFVALFGAAFFVGFSPDTSVSQVLAQNNGAANLADEVKTLAERITKNPERIWVYTYEIGALAAKDSSKLPMLASEVANLFESEDEGVRLAASTLVLALGEDGEALFEDAADICNEIIK
ncbi:MAG: hypothetical protein KDB07_07555, partial [Planctomycetes bacterium]|nr:hypothetical protein [Planctomycetota bacterium]